MVFRGESLGLSMAIVSSSSVGMSCWYEVSVVGGKKRSLSWLLGSCPEELIVPSLDSLLPVAERLILVCLTVHFVVIDDTHQTSWGNVHGCSSMVEWSTQLGSGCSIITGIEDLTTHLVGIEA